MRAKIGGKIMYFPSVKEVQEVNEQLRIIEYHPMVGFPGSVLGYTFEKILSCYGDIHIALSMAYSLGRIAGIRQERAEKRGEKNMTYPIQKSAMIRAAERSFTESGKEFTEIDGQFYSSLADLLNQAYEQGFMDASERICDEGK